MGAYMTTKMRRMGDVTRILNKEGIMSHLKVVVEGGAMTRSCAYKIGTDGYGNDSFQAVKVVDNLLGWER